MMSDKNKIPFDAEARTLRAIMSVEWQIGFNIPEYQREYDWSSAKRSDKNLDNNVKRLLSDCLNGFRSLTENGDIQHTFLGTIILVKEKSPKDDFGGDSLFVVDGQQRLITLALLCCALIELLKEHSKGIGSLQESTKNVIKKILKEQEGYLFYCTSGRTMAVDEPDTYYPKIIREEKDYRALDHRAEYKSAIAKFLNEFAKCHSKGKYFRPKNYIGKDENKDLICKNYEYIKEQLQHALYKHDDKKCDLEYEPIENKDFKENKLENLLGHIQNEIKNNVLKEIKGNVQSDGLIRLLLFSSYITKYIIIVRANTDDEDSAFDIFDALNTTGEPLTALDTLRPHVVRSKISEAKKNLDEIRDIFEKKGLNTEARQRRTKEIVTASALYIEGHKLPLNLASQRDYLRSKFKNITKDIDKIHFVKSIADIAKYQQNYWHNIAEQQFKSKDPKTLKLCLTLISDMNVSLIVPILARYWIEHGENSEEFTDAVKAITAFFVLRRSVTEGTEGIDKVFRNLMKEEPVNGKDPLCVGLDGSHKILEVEKFKKELREKLKDESIEVDGRETWVKQASAINLGEPRASKGLCRFLLLAYAHKSVAEGKSGLLSRDNVKNNVNEYLNCEQWKHERHGTIEHVAPVTPVTPGNWDNKIYGSPSEEQSSVVHTIGNLTLLPQNANSSAGNASWEGKEGKRKFYEDLTESRHSKEHRKIAEGIDKLEILTPLIDVENWDRDFIKKRTKNLLELAWEEIAPWLGYKKEE